jgi:hypothetical protein
MGGLFPARSDLIVKLLITEWAGKSRTNFAGIFGVMGTEGASTAPHGRSPALPEDSGMPGVGTGEIDETVTQPLLPCRFRAPASHALRSAARPSGDRSILPCEMCVLPFMSQVKNRMRRPSLNHALKSGIAFCV